MPIVYGDGKAFPLHSYARDSIKRFVQFLFCYADAWAKIFPALNLNGRFANHLKIERGGRMAW